MTNEARNEKDRTPIEATAFNWEMTAKGFELELKAQAEYSMKLKEILETAKNVSNRLPDPDRHEMMTTIFQLKSLLTQADALTPTEAMRQAAQAKEKAWLGAAAVAVYADWHKWNGMPPDQIVESILAELRKKDAP